MMLKKDSKGFTLIELLIVVAIIGILAAIAIPQFAAYRIRGYNSAAHSDAKNIVTGEEAYFVDFQSYLGIALQTGAGNVGSTGIGAGTELTGAKLSKNVTVKLIAGTTDGAFYSLGASHVQGDRAFYMESDLGKWSFSSNVAVKVAGATWGGAEVAAATSGININPAGLTTM